jgi:hypothetical protein
LASREKANRPSFDESRALTEAMACVANRKAHGRPFAPSTRGEAKSRRPLGYGVHCGWSAQAPVIWHVIVAD